MKLQDYLRGIRDCPDEVVKHDGREIHRLTADFGVYDNYLIIVNAHGWDLYNNLRKTGKFIIPSPEHSGDSALHYSPGTVVFHLREGNFGLYPQNPEYLKLSQRGDFPELEPLTVFKTRAIIQPYQGEGEFLEGGKKMPGVEWERAIALALEDICDVIIRNNWQACLPKSLGWAKHRDESQIVIFPDSLEEEFVKRVRGSQ